MLIAARSLSALPLRSWSVARGDRVLLCYLPGIEFITAFWGCLRIGAIAVPVYPPDPNKLAMGVKKLDLVRKSCDARLCLTERTLNRMRQLTSMTHTWPSELQWERSDVVAPAQAARACAELDALGTEVITPADDEVAFLQFTSGSTGDPKGVMLTFSNLWHNINSVYLPAQRQQFAVRGLPLCDGANADIAPSHIESDGARVVGVSWLPQFHDTGLVLCITAPFVAGYRMINYSPLTFLKDPLMWVRTLSQYRAHWSAAPDFAYELCTRRLRGNTLEGVSLRSVRLFACGAGERCRPPQLERFARTFERACSLRTDVWIPNYGLAEHVVATCGCADGIVLSKRRPDLPCCGIDFQVRANMRAGTLHREGRERASPKDENVTMLISRLGTPSAMRFSFEHSDGRAFSLRSALSSSISPSGVQKWGKNAPAHFRPPRCPALRFALGVAGAQIDLRIVNPDTFVEKPAGEPGEIWISSGSVALGYWGRPEQSEATFRARILREPSGPPKLAKGFLRTGDEGFMEVRCRRVRALRTGSAKFNSHTLSRHRMACSSSAVVSKI